MYVKKAKRKWFCCGISRQVCDGTSCTQPPCKIKLTDNRYNVYSQLSAYTVIISKPARYCCYVGSAMTDSQDKNVCTTVSL